MLVAVDESSEWLIGKTSRIIAGAKDLAICFAATVRVDVQKVIEKN